MKTTLNYWFDLRPQNDQKYFDYQFKIHCNSFKSINSQNNLIKRVPIWNPLIAKHIAWPQYVRASVHLHVACCMSVAKYFQPSRNCAQVLKETAAWNISSIFLVLGRLHGEWPRRCNRQPRGYENRDPELFGLRSRRLSMMKNVFPGSIG